MEGEEVTTASLRRSTYLTGLRGIKNTQTQFQAEKEGSWSET